jgi:4-deoxy-L-threo-5-hexosulose-uronate ketol-isomerase
MTGLAVRAATHPDELESLSTARLRERFLLEDLFAPGEARLALSHHDRIVVGGVVPGSSTVELEPPSELRARSFCDRRELGVVCLSGPGAVEADGERWGLEAEDVLYLGRGTERIAFSGSDAAFYLVSTPAHERHPAALSRRDDADAVALGEPEQANVRTIRKHVHDDGIRSAQLALGVTTLEAGSVWNTMPPHTHDRRTEVYLYFGMAPDQRVIHLCGAPDATRSLVLADRQAVISPPWSVHFGAGTGAYRFVWATGGENLAYNDMDPVDIDTLR